MTKLSIVIPTYQREGLVADSLREYLRLLKPSTEAAGIQLEVIVVDDCSPDRTFHVLEEHFFAVDSIKLVQLAHNSGPGMARDAGNDLATGEWVWFLDDDDALSLDGLETLFAQLVLSNQGTEILAHSLKKEYGGSTESIRLRLVNGIANFREHQEVFRYVIRRELLLRHKIRFSPGLHEDIRYMFEVLIRSSAVEVVPKQVVIKQRTPQAITAHMTEARIDGYIRAYNEIVELLAAGYSGAARLRREAFDQTLGVILYLTAGVNGDHRDVALIRYLDSVSDRDDAWSSAMRDSPIYCAKDTNFEFAGSLYRHKQGLGASYFLEQLREVFNSRLSCKDLDSSIFLGPDEIRACCKRFFVNGMRKGDVVLLKADESTQLSDIHLAKDRLISRINSREAPECSGCPYIERRPVRQEGVDYISLENFSYCNMRCTYCSPKYYDGKEALYNAAEIIEQLSESSEALSDHCHVVWGGGEPTLSPRFEPINQTLSKLSRLGKVRVLSNSLRFSEKLAAFMDDSRYQLVTSIDAGTDATFRKIRGKGDIGTVLNNLSRYQKILDDPRRLTIKYIICADNFESAELDAFVTLVKEEGLMSCLFQISCDFTIDRPLEVMTCALYELAIRLHMAGAQHVFFDDLVRDRVSVDEVIAQKIRNHLERLSLDRGFLLGPDANFRIVLWGNGRQAQWLRESTQAGRGGRIIDVISDASSWQDAPYSKASDIKVYPAGVQNMYEILKNIEGAGFGDIIFRGSIF